MRKYFAILGLFALLTQLLIGGLYQTAGVQAQELDSGGKISSLLTLQVEAKLRAAEAGGVPVALEVLLQAGRVDILQTPGIKLEDLSQQRIFIHLAQELTESQIQELRAMGITLYLDSWIPAVGGHPTGFLIADMPTDKLEELAGKDYIIRLDTAEPLRSSTLEEDLILNFSQTQFSFIDPMDGGPGIFKFKATNTGTKHLLIHFDSYCKSDGVEVGRPVIAPQGDTPLLPGESMLFKILPEGRHCGYDPNVPQTITRTLYMSFSDNNHNWLNPEDNSFSLEKTIQIKVINYNTLEGDVIIQGFTVNGEDDPIPYVQINLGGYGRKVPLNSDASGHFSYSITESPAYFLIAQKNGYQAATIEIDGTNVQDFYTVTLVHEPSPISVNASLVNSISGKIGFYRCAATEDGSRLLLVNGMENWEDESLKEQSKLYLLDTNTGEILWTHDMGWESWSADITDDGEYVVFGTRLTGFDTGPEGFINYIRLLDGTEGSSIWEKKITAENFPGTTQGEFYTSGVKFSHSGEYIFVPVEREYGYLLNRSDGTIKWHKWVGQNIREVLFTQDDQYVYIPSGSGWLYKLKVEDGSEVWKQWIGCWAFVNGFDLSPDEEYIAVGSKASYLTVINTSDGSIRFTKDFHGGSATSRFSPDGTRLIVGGGHSFTLMLDLDGNILWRYYGIGCDVRWSGDGRLIFSNNGNVFNIHGTMLYDIIPGSDRNTQVGWSNSDATRFIFAVRDTPSSENPIIEVYRVETSTNTSPVASFSYSPENPVVGQTITFDASSSYDPEGTITNYEWDFEDGNITSTPDVIITHSYASAGNYNVGLTVTDDDGLTDSTSTTINVAASSVLPGDANGDGNVNALDITKVERIIAGLDVETSGADANQDGNINALDITKIERIIAGLD